MIVDEPKKEKRNKERKENKKNQQKTKNKNNNLFVVVDILTRITNKKNMFLYHGYDLFLEKLNN